VRGLSTSINARRKNASRKRGTEHLGEKKTKIETNNGGCQRIYEERHRARRRRKKIGSIITGE